VLAIHVIHIPITFIDPMSQGTGTYPVGWDLELGRRDGQQAARW